MTPFHLRALGVEVPVVSPVARHGPALNLLLKLRHNLLLLGVYSEIQQIFSKPFSLQVKGVLTCLTTTKLVVQAGVVLRW